jgi:hypothetical protein
MGNKLSVPHSFLIHDQTMWKNVGLRKDATQPTLLENEIIAQIEEIWVYNSNNGEIIKRYPDYQPCRSG